MGFITKLLFGTVFIGLLYFAVDTLLGYAFGYGLPVLPANILWLVVNSGLAAALNIYLKIVIFGFILKQMIAYIRTVN